MTGNTLEEPEGTDRTGDSGVTAPLRDAPAAQPAGLRVSTWVDQLLQLNRIGIVMHAERDRPEEAWGVLNPASARDRDGELYLFPRLVAEGNYSRVGIAKVTFDARGEPVAAERLGVVLEPQESYELQGPGKGGVEDPRITYLPLVDTYVMSYVALGPEGPRIALAASTDLHAWRRLGLMSYEPMGGIDFGRCDNKDCVIFPLPVTDPEGHSAYAVLHRPIFAVHTEAGGEEWLMPPGVTDRRPSIWISYAPLARVHEDVEALTRVGGHHLLAAPLGSWEHHHIGSGAPPILSEEGWLLYYHGVLGLTPAGLHAPTSRLVYQSGVMLLDRSDPRKILYRSAKPVLLPDRPDEQHGIVPDVVFPTAVDVQGSRVDVYYGAADERIGVATTCMTGSALVGPSSPLPAHHALGWELPQAHGLESPAATTQDEISTRGADMRVRDIMTRAVEVVTPETSLGDAAQRMRTVDIGVLPIEHNGEVVGVVTDRDMTVRAIAQGLDLRTATVAEVMTTNVVSCYEDQTVEEAAEIMAVSQVRRLVVLDRARQLAGIVSLDDIARYREYAGIAAETLEYTSMRPDRRGGTFERILVALDGSPLAERVLDTVVPLALKLGARLTLLRAVARVPAPVAAGTREADDAGAAVSIGAEAPDDAEAYVTGVRRQIEARGLVVEQECTEGPASDVILRRARQLNVDLIALTTHGRTGMDRMLLGSVAEDVLRRTPCPILLVRVQFSQ